MEEFPTKFADEIISEWRAHYLDFSGLEEELANIKTNIILLAQAYNSMSRQLTDQSKEQIIYVDRTGSEIKFWALMRENMNKVEDWYRARMDTVIEQFHALAMQAIELNLIKEYEPYRSTQSTSLEREINRLNLSVNIQLLIHNKEAKETNVRNGCVLLPLHKDTNLGQVIETIRQTLTNPGGLDSSDSLSSSKQSSLANSRQPDMFGGSTDSAVTVQSSEDRKALKQPLLQKEQEEEEGAQEDQLFQLVSLEQTPTSRTSISIHRQIRSMDEIDVINAKSELQQAFLEFHHCVWLIHNFATLNQQAFQYFVDLHDSQIARDSDPSDFMLDLKACSFYAQVKTCDLLRKEVEHVYALAFTTGSRSTAKKELFIPANDSVTQTIKVSPVRLVISMSIGLILLLAVMYLILSSDHDALKSHRAHWIGYRILGLCCLFLWGWGIDVYLWTKYKVNYVFIFDFNPRRHHRYSSIFEAATLFSVLLVISVLLFLFTMTPSPPPGFEWMRKIPAFMHPLTAIIIFLGTFIVFQFKSQFWLLRCLFHVIIAPLTKVKFAHFFMADQLMSLSLVLNDISYFACYLVYDAGRHENETTCTVSNHWVLPLLALLPPFWRLMQCVRRYITDRSKMHIANGCKYSVALIVATAAILKSLYSNHVSFLVIWIVIVAGNTTFTYLWDIKFDWSLGDKTATNKGLRNTLLYPTSWYYFALAVNLVMRLTWTLLIFPEAIAKFIQLDLFTTLLAVIEICRRCLWNLFRLENEQLNNIGKFRAVNDVPLPVPVKYFARQSTDKI
jgi:hypothetical protein